MSRKQRKRGGARNIRDYKKSLPSEKIGSRKTPVKESNFEISGDILKVDEELGLVLGWGIVSTIDGKPYFDKQGDHIPDESMLKAAVDFMSNSRVAGEMHKTEEHGTVVFAWPLTAEIAKVYGIETKQTGLMLGMLPDRGMLEKFRNNEYKGFSIGGKRGEDEEVA